MPSLNRVIENQPMVSGILTQLSNRKQLLNSFLIRNSQKAQKNNVLDKWTKQVIEQMFSCLNKVNPET